MPESIGSAISGLSTFNINTQIPSLTDNADIQEALRLYHFGQPTGSGVGSHDPSDTNPASLVNPSIAYSLYSLQQQVTAAVAGSGVSGSTWTAKGALVSATAASTPTVLSVGTAGQVLTVNLGTSTGLQWVSPEVTLANAVTLTSKTLTAPKMSSTFIADTNGNELISFPAPVTSAVNEITVTNAITSGKPTISATGGDTNVSLNLVSKGTGTVQANGIEIVGISGTQTLINKTLTSPTVSQLYLSDSAVIFEGSSADAFETTLGVIDPTVDRTINLPNVDGTVITSGNLTDITSVGTLSSLAVTGNAVSHIAFNTTPTGSYTLVIGDDGKIVEIPTVGTLTVPTDSVAFPTGSQVTILQTSTGQVTLSGATVATGTYLSGGAASATTVVLTTYNTSFAANQTLLGTGFAANTTVSSTTTSVIAIGNVYYAGTYFPFSFIIREYRPLIVPNVLITGTNIALNTLVTSTTNITTDTATYHSGGASSATTVVVKERLPLVIAGQRLSATGLTGNQTVSSIAETSITTAVYNSGGASGASTIIVASNANIFVGQRVTGTGITGNVYVSAVSTSGTTTITLGQSPNTLSGVGTVSYSAYTLNVQASGTYTFLGATITFSPGANAQISGSVLVTGTNVSHSPNSTAVVSGTATFSGTIFSFSPAAASQISGTITGNVTINGTPGLKLRTQYSSATLIKRGSNRWVALGDLTA